MYIALLCCRRYNAYMSYTFTVAITKEDDWYVAQAIEYGVASQGKTIAEAKKNIIEAVELYLEELSPSERKKAMEKPIVAQLEARV